MIQRLGQNIMRRNYVGRDHVIGVPQSRRQREEETRRQSSVAALHGEQAFKPFTPPPATSPFFRAPFRRRGSTSCYWISQGLPMDPRLAGYEVRNPRGLAQPKDPRDAKLLRPSLRYITRYFDVFSARRTSTPKNAYRTALFLHRKRPGLRAGETHTVAS